MHIEKTTTEILCAELDNVRHDPCIKPIITEVADLEHSCEDLKGYFYGITG